MLSTSYQTTTQQASTTTGQPQHPHQQREPAATHSSQPPTMSYGYGPTVVYPAFNMAQQPFGTSTAAGSYAKENYSTVHASVKEAFAVYEESSCEHSTMQQAASTSSRVPFAERNQNSTSTTTSVPAGKRTAGVAPAPCKPHNQQHAVQHQQRWKDIDAENQDNPLACSEYAQQIFEYLANAEATARPNPGYVSNVQHDMSPHMRRILVDWLVEVAQEYRLTSDTLHLTMDLLNRYLSLEPVAREELQLAGIACMWIAAKFEEIYAPTARNFCYITDNTYSQQQLVEMEAKVLERLEFRVALPTAKTFQRRILQAAAADEDLHYLSAFLLELCLMDEQLLKYLPSQVAAASVYLAGTMLGRTPWDPTLAHYSRYGEAAVLPIAAELAFNHVQLQSDGAFTAILEKYSSDRLRGVATLPVCEAILVHSERWQQYQQQYQQQQLQQLTTPMAAGGASSSEDEDESPIAGCFCSDMSSDMDLV